MRFSKKERVGNVDLLIQKEAFHERYIDTAEVKLEQLFQDEDFDSKIEAFISGEISWPLLYHLSPARENLLNWFQFAPSWSLLEVGAGCGALTGLFSRSVEKVDALELTEQRARILAMRHWRMENLTVIAGNLEKFTTDQKYDIVTSIGVLEYAGLYSEESNPHLSFLKTLKKLLGKDGQLILAIENRLGLKYWAGCKEDHTSAGLDSIQGYPRLNKIKTFGRLELKDLLGKAGFNSIQFYYPLPDYKLPREIYSERLQPNREQFIGDGVLPTIDLSLPREFIFSESLVMESLIKNNLFQDFANSFLVFAK